MKEKIVECYRNNKLILKINVLMNEDTFSKFIKDGILVYSTSDLKSSEIIYLKNFDKVIVNNFDLFGYFKGSGKDG